MPKSDQSLYDLDYLFAYLELPNVKNPLFHQKWTCNLECEISGMSPDFHNKILPKTIFKCRYNWMPKNNI